MEMKVVTFFVFLTEAYRQDAAEKLSWLPLAIAGQGDEKSIDKLAEFYRDASGRPEHFDPNDYSAIERLKGEL